MSTPSYRWRPSSPAVFNRSAATTELAEVRAPSQARANLAARYAKQAARPVFIPSAQQAEFFEAVRLRKNSILLEAVAGAGKTTTVIEALRLLSGTVFCAAYGKDAAADMKKKAEKADVLRPGIHISTLHASGYGQCKKAWPHAEVDDSKTRKCLSALIEEGAISKEALGCVPFISKMVSFGKQFLMGCAGKPSLDNMAVWLQLVTHFSVDQDLPEEKYPLEEALMWVIDVMRRSLTSCAKYIDFDDMIYAPIAHNLRFFTNDTVVLDEVQDVNPARREYAKRSLKRDGIFIGVGDRFQAIFGFTGAGGDSIDRVIEEFSCVTMPLSVSYRCPQKVIEYAQQWVPHIQAHPSAAEGEVRLLDTTKLTPAQRWFHAADLRQEDVIICRYTRPLIQTAYALLKENKACKVEGRDIGKGLVALATLWKITSIARLEERLGTYLVRECEKARKLFSEKREEEVCDRVETLRVFIARCKSLGMTTIDQLTAEIRALFDDNVSGVLTLCSGHKSKGREWKRVYWLRTESRGRRSKDWEAQEELNVEYVISTRAQELLVLVPPAATERLLQAQ